MASHVILKDVVLSAEYDLEKLDQQITEAKKNNALAKAYFNFLINRSLEEPVEADTSLISSLPLVNPLQTYTNQRLKIDLSLIKLTVGNASINRFLICSKKTPNFRKYSWVRIPVFKDLVTIYLARLT